MSFIKFYYYSYHVRTDSIMFIIHNQNIHPDSDSDADESCNSYAIGMMNGNQLRFHEGESIKCGSDKDDYKQVEQYINERRMDYIEVDNYYIRINGIQSICKIQDVFSIAMNNGKTLEFPICGDNYIHVKQYLDANSV